MKARAKLTVNPYFDQFIYDLVYHAPVEDRYKMSRKYIMACKNPTSLKAFLKKASVEEKDEMLLQLGIESFKIYFERGYPQKRYVREVFAQYKIEVGGKGHYLVDAIKNKMFVTSDREFAIQLGLMSKIHNHNVYTQSLLLNKAGYHLEKWKKDGDNEEMKTAQEQLRITEFLVTTILNTVQTYEFVQGLTGLLQNDMKILFYLYSLKTYVDYEKIVKRFSGDMTKNKVTSAIRRLYKGQYVSKSFIGRKYEISGLGIMQVNTFFQTVLKANSIQ
jgi:hypothetical protein